MLPVRSLAARTLRATSVARAGLLVCLLLAGWMGFEALRPAPSRALGAVHEIEILGRGHAWHVRYPGPDAELGTADDVLGLPGRPVHLPLGVPTRVLLHSDDYIYSLRVPALGVNLTARTSSSVRLWSEPLATSRIALMSGPVGSMPLSSNQ